MFQENLGVLGLVEENLGGLDLRRKIWRFLFEEENLGGFGLGEENLGGFM